MRIAAVRVQNYKSFADSGAIQLSPSFTVLVGKNNSGKTAFLEALRRGGSTSMPHRDTSLPRGAPSAEISKFEITFEVTPEEMTRHLLTFHQRVKIPVGNLNSDSVVDAIFKKNGIKSTLTYNGGAPNPRAPYPSHGLFSQAPKGGGIVAFVARSDDRQSYRLDGGSAGDNDDPLPQMIEAIASSKVFVFSAERVGTSSVQFNSSPTLASNAENLPRALFQMQQNPLLWTDFNANVNRILPNVREVVLRGESTSIEIELWPVEPRTMREDLKVRLKDSGTGVAQVLAILCAAMTIENGVIAIDEPSNFLHPGAVKALIGILKRYEHQYVITTHSLDAVTAATPAKICLVTWADCVSTISTVNIPNVDAHKRLLAELGVALSDVFGMDAILWVEGETEEICIPIVLQNVLGHMPPTTAIVRVRSTGELVGKKDAAAIWEIYSRLSSAGGAIPAETKFLFDRERRSQTEMADLNRASKGTAKFLNRRTYENYLLDPALLLEELNEEAATHNLPELAQEDLKSWIDQNASRFSPEGSWAGDVHDLAWKAVVDAPKLLNALFTEKIKSAYRKTRNSPSLTRRLLATGGPDCDELKAVVAEAMKPSGPIAAH